MIVEGNDEVTGQPNTIEVDKQDYWMTYYDCTEAGIYDRSFFKLRDVTVNYDLHKLWGINMSVYGFARKGNGNMSGYFERFPVPAASSFGGGLKISF